MRNKLNHHAFGKNYYQPTYLVNERGIKLLYSQIPREKCLELLSCSQGNVEDTTHAILHRSDLEFQDFYPQFKSTLAKIANTDANYEKSVSQVRYRDQDYYQINLTDLFSDLPAAFPQAYWLSLVDENGASVAAILATERGITIFTQQALLLSGQRHYDFLKIFSDSPVALCDNLSIAGEFIVFAKRFIVDEGVTEISSQKLNLNSSQLIDLQGNITAGQISLRTGNFIQAGRLEAENQLIIAGTIEQQGQILAKDEIFGITAHWHCAEKSTLHAANTIKILTPDFEQNGFLATQHLILNTYLANIKGSIFVSQKTLIQAERFLKNSETARLVFNGSVYQTSDLTAIFAGNIFYSPDLHVGWNEYHFNENRLEAELPRILSLKSGLYLELLGNVHASNVKLVICAGKKLDFSGQIWHNATDHLSEYAVYFNTREIEFTGDITTNADLQMQIEGDFEQQGNIFGANNTSILASSYALAEDRELSTQKLGIKSQKNITIRKKAKLKPSELFLAECDSFFNFGLVEGGAAVIEARKIIYLNGKTHLQRLYAVAPYVISNGNLRVAEDLAVASYFTFVSGFVSSGTFFNSSIFSFTAPSLILQTRLLSVNPAAVFLTLVTAGLTVANFVAPGAQFITLPLQLALNAGMQLKMMQQNMKQLRSNGNGLANNTENATLKMVTSVSQAVLSTVGSIFFGVSAYNSLRHGIHYRPIHFVTPPTWPLLRALATVPVRLFSGSNDYSLLAFDFGSVFLGAGRMGSHILSVGAGATGALMSSETSLAEARFDFSGVAGPSSVTTGTAIIAGNVYTPTQHSVTAYRDLMLIPLHGKLGIYDRWNIQTPLIILGNSEPFHFRHSSVDTGHLTLGHRIPASVIPDKTYTVTTDKDGNTIQIIDKDSGKIIWTDGKEHTATDVNHRYNITTVGNTPLNVKPGTSAENLIVNSQLISPDKPVTLDQKHPDPNAVPVPATEKPQETESTSAQPTPVSKFDENTTTKTLDNGDTEKTTAFSTKFSDGHVETTQTTTLTHHEKLANDDTIDRKEVTKTITGGEKTRTTHDNITTKSHHEAGENGDEIIKAETTKTHMVGTKTETTKINSTTTTHRQILENGDFLRSDNTVSYVDDGKKLHMEFSATSKTEVGDRDSLEFEDSYLRANLTINGKIRLINTSYKGNIDNHGRLEALSSAVQGSVTSDERSETALNGCLVDGPVTNTGGDLAILGSKIKGNITNTDGTAVLYKDEFEKTDAAPNGVNVTNTDGTMQIVDSKGQINELDNIATDDQAAATPSATPTARTAPHHLPPKSTLLVSGCDLTIQKTQLDSSADNTTTTLLLHRSTYTEFDDSNIHSTMQIGHATPAPEIPNKTYLITTDKDGNPIQIIDKDSREIIWTDGKQHTAADIKNTFTVKTIGDTSLQVKPGTSASNLIANNQLISPGETTLDAAHPDKNAMPVPNTPQSSAPAPTAASTTHPTPIKTFDRTSETKKLDNGDIETISTVKTQFSDGHVETTETKDIKHQETNANGDKVEIRDITKTITGGTEPHTVHESATTTTHHEAHADGEEITSADTVETYDDGKTHESLHSNSTTKTHRDVLPNGDTLKREETVKTIDDGKKPQVEFSAASKIEIGDRNTVNADNTNFTGNVDNYGREQFSGGSQTGGVENHGQAAFDHSALTGPINNYEQARLFVSDSAVDGPINNEGGAASVERSGLKGDVHNRKGGTAVFIADHFDNVNVENDTAKMQIALSDGNINHLGNTVTPEKISETAQPATTTPGEKPVEAPKALLAIDDSKLNINSTDFDDKGVVSTRSADLHIKDGRNNGELDLNNTALDAANLTSGEHAHMHANNSLIAGEQTGNPHLEQSESVSALTFTDVERQAFFETHPIPHAVYKDGGLDYKLEAELYTFKGVRHDYSLIPITYSGKNITVNSTIISYGNAFNIHATGILTFGDAHVAVSTTSAFTGNSEINLNHSTITSADGLKFASDKDKGVFNDFISTIIARGNISILSAVVNILAFVNVTRSDHNYFQRHFLNSGRIYVTDFETKIDISFIISENGEVSITATKGDINSTGAEIQGRSIKLTASGDVKLLDIIGINRHYETKEYLFQPWRDDDETTQEFSFTRASHLLGQDNVTVKAGRDIIGKDAVIETNDRGSVVLQAQHMLLTREILEYHFEHHESGLLFGASNNSLFSGRDFDPVNYLPLVQAFLQLIHAESNMGRATALPNVTAETINAYARALNAYRSNESMMKVFANGLGLSLDKLKSLLDITAFIGEKSVDMHFQRESDGHIKTHELRMETVDTDGKTVNDGLIDVNNGYEIEADKATLRAPHIRIAGAQLTSQMTQRQVGLTATLNPLQGLKDVGVTVAAASQTKTEHKPNIVNVNDLTLDTDDLTLRDAVVNLRRLHGRADRVSIQTGVDIESSRSFSASITSSGSFSASATHAYKETLATPSSFFAADYSDFQLGGLTTDNPNPASLQHSSTGFGLAGNWRDLTNQQTPSLDVFSKWTVSFMYHDNMINVAIPSINHVGLAIFRENVIGFMQKAAVDNLPLYLHAPTKPTTQHTATQHPTASAHTKPVIQHAKPAAKPKPKPVHLDLSNGSAIAEGFAAYSYAQSHPTAHSTKPQYTALTMRRSEREEHEDESEFLHHGAEHLGAELPKIAIEHAERAAAQAGESALEEIFPSLYAGNLSRNTAESVTQGTKHALPALSVKGMAYQYLPPVFVLGPAGYDFYEEPDACRVATRQTTGYFTGELGLLAAARLYSSCAVAAKAVLVSTESLGVRYACRAFLASGPMPFKIVGAVGLGVSGLIGADGLYSRYLADIPAVQATSHYIHNAALGVRDFFRTNESYIPSMHQKPAAGLDQYLANSVDIFSSEYSPRAEIPSMYATSSNFDAYLPALRAGFVFNEFPPMPEPMVLYRGDARSFDTIFNEGFTAQGTNMDLANHAVLYQEANDSAFVSTSTVRETAARFPTHPDGNTWLYEIQTTRIPIDTAKELSNQFARGEIQLHAEDFAIYLAEQERAFPYKVPVTAIKGTWEVNIEKTVWDFDSYQYTRTLDDAFILNPNYRAPYYYERLFLNGTRALGYLGLAIGAGLDTAGLYREYQQSTASGDFYKTQREAARITGAWSAASTLGSASAMAGAAYCAPIAPPYGPAACALVSGLAGSFIGYQSGSITTGNAFDDLLRQRHEQFLALDVSRSSAAFFASQPKASTQIPRDLSNARFGKCFH